MNTADPSGWRARRIAAAGVTIAAYEAGSEARDAEVVVLVHGLGHWTDAAWGRLVARLDQTRRYVAFDLPGFGASDKPAARYDQAFFRRVVDDAVAELATSRFALVGHSLGGFIAADWAGVHPDRVSRLALIAPGGFARTPRHVAVALLARLFGGAFARVVPSRRFVRAQLRRAAAAHEALDPEHVERLYALSQELAFRRAFGGVYAAAVDTFFNRRELHAAFARYRGPVFCAWGRHDRFINVAGLCDVTRVYPHAATQILENSGHLPMIEEPQQLAEALETFLA